MQRDENQAMRGRDLAECRGMTLVTAKGDELGEIDDVYVDDQDGSTEWITVRTGLFGRNVSFVPAGGLSRQGDRVTARWDAAKIKDAPNVDPDGHLSPEEEQRLYTYYGVKTAQGRRGRETTGHDTSGPTTDDAMTRSEEEMRVAKSSSERGRARLRKWIETEHVEREVPVSRDRAVVEREPITDANRGKAMSGPDLSEEEHEVPLYEEEVVAQTEVVPKERVRLDKETVTEQERVGADLRKERIEAEGDIAERDRKR